MKFSHIIVSFAALNGAASSVYAKETSEASSVVGDGHISPLGHSEEPLRGQLVEVDTSAKEPDDTRRQLAKAGKGGGKRRELAKAGKGGTKRRELSAKTGKNAKV